MHEARVLFGREEVVERSPPVAIHVVQRSRSQFHELPHRGLLARFSHAGRHRVAVRLAVRVEVLETGVPVASPSRGVRIHSFEVLEYRLDRTEHAVQVQSVEPDALAFLDRFVV